MGKVSMFASREIDEKFPETRPVTSLEVARANASQPALIVSLGIYQFGVRDHHCHELVLSLPAATRLSHDLQKAVEDYLQGDMETENQ